MLTPSEEFNLADYLLDQRIRDGQGDRLALITDDGQLTYAQVQSLANQAAHALAAQGLEREQRLLLALPDSWDYVAALFGALKLGAVVVMANPALSDQEMTELAHYVRAKVTLTLDQREDFRSQLRAQSPVFENVVTHRDDIALWLFSGGTTGRPKAVLQSHQSFFNTTELYAKAFLGYRAEDRTLSVPKLFFGYATGSNLFFPFSVGASAILFEDKCTPEVLFAKIARHRPTILVNVPTMVNHLVSHPEAGQQDFSCLRFSTSAGEALPEALYHRWREVFACELLDGLGTAEMWHVFLSNAPGQARAGTLGRPVPGFDVKICDDSGVEVPQGQVGRLWVAGDSRALCYWQRGELSQEALRGRYYVSSDLMSCDPDGYFSYCGRADEMLKVSGRWLAPQEVESCLLTHPAVAECAVVGIVGQDGLTRPHAYVIATETGDDLEDQLKAHVLAQLEAYKHPRRVYFVDELPRTHLGKVNRALLRSAQSS